MSSILNKYHIQNSHTASAWGAIERLVGVPDFGLTAVGFGEDGRWGAATDSLVRELLYKIRFNGFIQESIKKN